MSNNNITAFYSLIRAGLWADVDVHLDLNKKVDWDEVYQLAEEQSVIGLVLAGLEHSIVKPPQELLLQWIGEVQMLEQQNKAMNQFVRKLVDKMRGAEIYTLLVKGHGVAQCYERPLWRSCGDVDFYLSKENYEKAKRYLNPLASSIGKEDKRRLHYDITIEPWLVELHGTMYTELSKRMNSVLDDVHRDIFNYGNVRSWNNNGAIVFLPSEDNDVVIVFSHFINHFYGEGVGLRQICDWCRLLWTYRDSLNHGILKSRIKKAGLMTEWMTFAAFAVEYLGMPVEAMPFYDESPKYSKKAKKLATLIIESGSLKANSDNGYRNNKPKWKAHFITFCKRLGEFVRIAKIFPVNSPQFFVTYTFNRFKAVV